MALQEKTGDEQKRKQRVLGVHTANTAGVSTAAHFAHKARTTISERTFAPQSLFLSANAGRGTTERGTRRNRTQGETRSNAGRRSPKSIGIELAMMGRGGNTALDVAMCDISFFAESFLWL